MGSYMGCRWYGVHLQADSHRRERAVTFTRTRINLVENMLREGRWGGEGELKLRAAAFAKSPTCPDASRFPPSLTESLLKAVERIKSPG